MGVGKRALQWACALVREVRSDDEQSETKLIMCRSFDQSLILPIVLVVTFINLSKYTSAIISQNHNYVYANENCQCFLNITPILFIYIYVCVYVCVYVY